MTIRELINQLNTLAEHHGDDLLVYADDGLRKYPITEVSRGDSDDGTLMRPLPHITLTGSTP